MDSIGFVSKAKYTQLERENEELKKEIAVLQKRIEDLASAHNKAIEEARKATLRCKEFQGNLLPLEAENSELKTKVQSLTEERELFQKLINELSHKAQRHKKEA